MRHYAARRLMALFRAYEVFPHDPEFIRLTALPIIEVEITQAIKTVMTLDSSYIYHFQNEAEHQFHDGLAKRELNVVQGLLIDMPTRENGKRNIRIMWNLLFHPTVQHSLDIPIDFIPQVTMDALMDKAQSRIRNVVKILQHENNTEQEQ